MTSERHARAPRGIAATLAVLACATGSATSGAQAPPEKGPRADARTLLKEGYALIKQGDYRAGCHKFEASLALFPAASTMINLARCHLHGSLLVTASRDYQRALALCAEEKDPARRQQLEEMAR